MWDRVAARTGLMLFLVTTVFILAWTPYWVMYYLMYNYPNSISVLVQLHVINLLGSSYYVNNAVNPIIYTFVNKTFRDEIFNIILCREGRTDNSTGQTTMRTQLQVKNGKPAEYTLAGGANQKASAQC